MALFRKFFYRKPPDGLLEISERVYVFDCCFTTDVLEEDEFKVYMGGLIAQLRDHSPNASFMVFNFREGERQSQLANILSEYDMMVMDYPRQYEGCPLLTLEMIHHYLRSSENWLSLGQRNILLMHCERGGWSALAFMLAALLIYRKQYTGEQKTLDMIYRQAPRELLQLLSPLNPLPSQLRYLQYVSRRNVGTGWPPLDRALTLDCVILRILPHFDGEGGCRPIFRIYGKDPLIANDRTPKILYSTPKKSKAIRLYQQADCELIKIDICCHIRGDVVLECINLDDDLEREMMMFRIMFNTAFIRSNILMLNRDEIDILWDAKEQFSKDFRVEVLLSDMDTVSSVMTAEVTAVEDKEGLPVEAFAKVQEIFNTVDWLDRNEDASLQHLNLAGLENDLKQKLDNITPQKPESKYIITESSCEKFQIDASHKKIGESMPCSRPSEKQSALSAKISESTKETNQRTSSQDMRVATQFAAQPNIVFPWGRGTSLSAPASHGNSLQGLPGPISRYQSTRSVFGITALLHDCHVNGNVKVPSVSETSQSSLRCLTTCSRKEEGSAVTFELQQPAEDLRLTLSSPGFQPIPSRALPTEYTMVMSSLPLLASASTMSTCFSSSSSLSLSVPSMHENPSSTPKCAQMLLIPNDSPSLAYPCSPTLSPQPPQAVGQLPLRSVCHEFALFTSPSSSLAYRSSPSNPSPSPPSLPPSPPLSPRKSYTSRNRENFLVSPPPPPPPPPPLSSQPCLRPLQLLYFASQPPPPPRPLSPPQPSYFPHCHSPPPYSLTLPEDTLAPTPSSSPMPSTPQSFLSLSPSSQKSTLCPSLLPPSSSSMSLAPPPPPPPPFTSPLTMCFVPTPAASFAVSPTSYMAPISISHSPPSPLVAPSSTLCPSPPPLSQSMAPSSTPCPPLPPPPPPPPLGPSSTSCSCPPPPPMTPLVSTSCPPSPSPPSVAPSFSISCPPPPSPLPLVTSSSPFPPQPPPPPLAQSSIRCSSPCPPSIARPPPPPPPLLPKKVQPANVSPTPPPPPPLLLSSSNSVTPTSQKSPPGLPIPPPPLVAMKGPGNAPSHISNGMGVSMGMKGRNLTCSGPRNSLSLQKRTSLKPLHWVKVTRAMQGSLWAESQEASKAPEFDMSELESLFAVAVPGSNAQGSGEKSGRRASLSQKPERVQLIDLRRANNCEIMLTKLKMPLPDLMSSVLALDDSLLDVDQVENLIKFCPTKEEMELLKIFKGNKESLGKCEQYFLELMKVPRVESKLRVFFFKIQFQMQVSDLSKNLNIVKSAAAEIRSSVKLKRIMQTILSLGNALNQGTARGSAVGFRLDSLLKLIDTRARNNKMTLMHYLCKVLADKMPELIEFSNDLISLEVASKIQLKALAEEMQAIHKGLEKVEQELTASENDGPVSQTFRKTLKGFLVGAEAEVRALALLYSEVGRNADALAQYFGEDPARCPFEQVISTLLNFVRMFTRAHEENLKQIELEKKKAQKEAEIAKQKVTTPTKAENEKLKCTTLQKQAGESTAF